MEPIVKDLILKHNTAILTAAQVMFFTSHAKAVLSQTDTEQYLHLIQLTVPGVDGVHGQPAL